MIALFCRASVARVFDVRLTRHFDAILPTSQQASKPAVDESKTEATKETCKRSIDLPLNAEAKTDVRALEHKKKGRKVLKAAKKVGGRRVVQHKRPTKPAHRNPKGAQHDPSQEPTSAPRQGPLLHHRLSEPTRMPTRMQNRGGSALTKGEMAELGTVR